MDYNYDLEFSKFVLAKAFSILLYRVSHTL